MATSYSRTRYLAHTARGVRLSDEIRIRVGLNAKIFSPAGWGWGLDLLYPPVIKPV